MAEIPNGKCSEPGLGEELESCGDTGFAGIPRSSMFCLSVVTFC